jgi:hypothetical protein
MIREVNLLGVPPERVNASEFTNGRIALGIATCACEEVKKEGYWKSQNIYDFTSPPQRGLHRCVETLFCSFSLNVTARLTAFVN